MSESVTFKPRMELVDALRGFALMGLFLVHSVELFELYWGKNQPDALTEHVFFAFMAKSFSMLALCFGFSFFVIMDRAKARNQAFEGRFAWRMIILMIFGAIHSLLYRGDILVVMGLAGLAMLVIDRIKSIKILWLLAIVLLLQPFILFQISQAAQGAAWANANPLYFNDPAMAVYMNGTFPEVIKANLVDGQIAKWSFMLQSGRFVQLIALFTIGLILGRIGFFERPQDFKVARYVGLVVLVGLYATIHFARPVLLAGLPSDGRAGAMMGDLLNGIRDLSHMGIYVLLFISLYLGVARPLLNTLAASGRMTLTLYLVQSIIFVPVFYGFGLRGFEVFQPWQSLLIGVSFCLFQIWFANQWFKGYYYGPMEWLWRALTLTTTKVPFKR